MQYNPANPLIVQGDRTILLKVDNPLHAEARDTDHALRRAGEEPRAYSHLPPHAVLALERRRRRDDRRRDGRGTRDLFQVSHSPEPTCRSARSGKSLWSSTARANRRQAPAHHQGPAVAGGGSCGSGEYAITWKRRLDPTSFGIDDAHRGVLKQALIAVGYPAEDLAGYTPGTAGLLLNLRHETLTGLPFLVRDYQKGAVDAFHAGGDVKGGSGVIVLPCGEGKTIVGLAALGVLQTETLVLTTSTTAVEQWRCEILDKTDIDPAKVTTYTGDSAIRV